MLADVLAYVTKNYKPIEKSFEPNLPCVVLWSLMVFFTNGDVPLCNIDFNNKYPTGSVMKNSIRELWHSKVMQQRREWHLKSKKSTDVPGTLCGGSICEEYLLSHKNISTLRPDFVL